MFGWFNSKKSTKVDAPIVKKVENFTDPSAVLRKFTAITGIHFNQKESITTSKLINFCRNHHITSFDELLSCFDREHDILEALINLLTVNETYFFRESRQIFFLCAKAVEKNESIRILCAPGSTGEEPYSIAIALLDAGILPQKIEIVSVDINSDVITLAKEGHYSLRSLHKTALPLQEKYFNKVDDLFYIRDEVKRLVTFHTLNIFDDALFTLGKFDTIFSRNMLIYFDEVTVIRAVDRLGRLARDKDAMFFFGHADFVKAPASLVEHYEQGVKFYKLS